MENLHINSLDLKECEMFIKSIVKDIPSDVLRKLTNVSNGNPFYIVQFIEYLLEINFATLLNRNTVGMMNINTFSSQKYIPRKIEQLIEKRQQGLLQLKEGKRYIDFLKILSLFGISAPEEILDEYWGTQNSEMLEPLFCKHYLAYDDDGNIKFDHETLYLFYAKEMKQCILKISKLVAENHQEIMRYLNDFTRGKILFYAGQYAEAEKLFSPILNDVRNAENISSANLSREYFEYMEEVYQLAKRNKNHILQEKIVQASVYIPMHTMDYGTTINAIDNAIDKINKNHSSNIKLRNSILQLQAHAELTAAKLKQAEQLFLEMLAEERLDSNNFSPENRFDLFDRTASLYTRYNHQFLAQKYNSLSEKIAYEQNDPKLICLSIMMKAKIHYYNDTNLSIQHMQHAKTIMANNKSYRIYCHNNVALVGANALLEASKGYHFKEYINDVKSLLAEAIDNNYSFIIIRCNLLLAALYYLTEENNSIELSKKYIDDGINASIRYGCEKLMNFFYNLKAVISIREGYSPEITLEYFETMLSFLYKQNLLFLGNLDFCYGNIISITNYAKFIYNYGNEQLLYGFFNKLSYYQSNKVCDFECSKRKKCYYSCSKNIKVFKKNIQQIEEKKLIFLDTKYQYPLYDPHTGYYIVVF